MVDLIEFKIYVLNRIYTFDHSLVDLVDYFYCLTLNTIMKFIIQFLF